ncbi:HlyD family secretion protein [Paracoccus sp. (in: a-proteobacteria)]|uniref:HlyD family secretion protein n=1 Tax=Paracoccus sp. TaxID=267 RepID=UPI00321FA9AB
MSNPHKTEATAEAGNGSAPKAASGNPLRRIALIVVVLTASLYVVSLVMERFTPTSSQAVVQAFVVPMAAEVSGRVAEVSVVDNAAVKAGQVLFRIDPRPYEIAVTEAESRLERIGQTIGANTAKVDAAQARLVEARARAVNVSEQANRSFQLVERGIYAQSKHDEAKAALASAEASVAGAEAELAKAQQELGSSGADNPQIKEALAALERARLDLIRTTVTAPADGAITNLQLAAGQFVGVGQRALTFVDSGTIWIAAAFKENSLEHISSGDPVEVVLDTLPGRIFKARVESVGWGATSSSLSAVDANGLPVIRNRTTWVRDPQLFPVRLVFEGDWPRGSRLGSQAAVVIYTGDRPVMNAIASAWVRFLSVLTYAT